MADLQSQIEELWTRAGELSPADTDALAVVSSAIDLLDRGTARVAEVDPVTDEVVVHQWLKQAILLLFRLRSMETMEVGPFEFADKLPLKRDFAAAGVRVVPLPGRRGHLHAELRQHRRPGGGGHHGRHLGDRGVVRPDR
jgi:2,3,4,5-tetrahydropyridine-2-carboxylate N-succinyltransferase